MRSVLFAKCADHWEHLMATRDPGRPRNIWQTRKAVGLQQLWVPERICSLRALKLLKCQCLFATGLSKARDVFESADRQA